MSSLLRKVKDFLMKNSTMEIYSPLIYETTDEKVQRIIHDKSGLDPIKYPNPLPLTQSTLKLEEEKASLCFDPLSNWLIVWYFFVFQAIIFFYTQMTIVLTFGHIAWQAQLDTVVVLVLNAFYTAILIADIFIQFTCGYITNSAIILNRQRVVHRYTHYYFYFDLIFVIVIIIALSVQVYGINWGKILIMFKFLRMFEMDQIMLRKVSTKVKARLLYQISKQFVTIYVLSELWGIFFYLMDNTMVNSQICQNNNNLCWLYSSTAYSPINSLPWHLQYFYTLYWGVNTMCQISYGDIAPNNPYQTPYALAGMCFGFVVYSYIVNNITKAIIWAAQRRDQFRVNLVIFDQYMENLKLSKEDQLDIVTFLKTRFREEQNRKLDMESLMKSTLPQDLKVEFTRNAYGHMAQGLDFFMGGKSAAVTRMLFQLNEKKYSENENIIKQGNPVNDLHFLHKGTISLYCQCNSQHYLVRQLNIPDTFLLAYQFFLNHHSNLSIIATHSSVLYFIPWDTFEQQSLRDIQFKQSYHLLQYQLFIKQKLQRIFYSCYICKEGHHWYDCPKIFPTFKDVCLEPFEKEKEKQNYRIVNNKHKTLKNISKLEELDRIVKRNKDRMLSRLEARIFTLKKQLKIKKQMFDVDCAYDWPSYLIEENLTRLKEEWNNRHGRLQRKSSVTNILSLNGNSQ